MSTELPISRPGGADLALLMLTAMIWASAFAAIKVSVVEVGPVWTAAMRVFIGFLALVPFAVFTGVNLPETPVQWGWIALIASLYSVIPFAMISWGLQRVDAGIGALLMGTTPFMAMVLGHFFTQDEKINRFKIVGVLLGLGGIVTVVGPGILSGIGSVAVASQFAIICGAWCYVIAGLLLRRTSMRPIEFTLLSLGIGSAMLIVGALAIEGIPGRFPSNEVLIALLWLGVFPTGLAYILRFHLVRRVGVGTFALSMNTIPVFGIIFGAVLLGEDVTWETIFALCLVMGGVLVARLGTPKLEGSAKLQ